MKQTAQQLNQQIVKGIGEYEALGNKRLAIMALVTDQIKAVDDGRKEAKEKVVKAFKEIESLDVAVKTANLLAPAASKADDATRKRLSRRRNFLKGILADQFPSYDFEVGKGRASEGIHYTFVGDADVREAKRLTAAVARIKELTGKTTATVETVAAAIKAGKGSQTVQTVDPVQAVAADPVDFASVADKAAALAESMAGTTATTGDQLEQEQEQENQKELALAN